jgi:hypothetical protein
MTIPHSLDLRLQRLPVAHLGVDHRLALRAISRKGLIGLAFVLPLDLGVFAGEMAP